MYPITSTALSISCPISSDPSLQTTLPSNGKAPAFIATKLFSSSPTIPRLQFCNSRDEQIDWELRPGGMLVQKRDDGGAASGPMIKIKVSHGSYQHDISVPAQATFGDLKRILSQETGLEPQEQRLLSRGKQKDDEECLHMVGVKDMSKIVLMEDPTSKERKLEEMKRNEGISRACEAVAQVRAEVDKLSEKVSPKGAVTFWSRITLA